MVRKTIRRKNSSQGRNTGIWLLALILITAGLWWGFIHEKEEPIMELPKPVLNGQDADYQERSQEIQKRLKIELNKSEVNLQTSDILKKETERIATGGKIIWQVQDIYVRTDKEIKVENLITKITLNEGEIVINMQNETQLLGENSLRYDIAIRDILDDGVITMTVARIFLIYSTDKDLIKGKKDKERKTDVLPLKPPAQKLTKGYGKLAIVVDDCGADLVSQRIYESLGRKFTFAVMPNLSYTHEAAESGHKAGMEIILHLPMEPISGQGMEQKTIMTNMSETQIKQATIDAIKQVPYVIGVNNHQGSKATADKRVMKTILSVLKERELYFFDSRTNIVSVGAAIAEEMGIRTASNELFLDNSTDKDSIRQKLVQAGDISLRDGTCIVIGHCRPNTASAIRDIIPELESRGVELVFLSQLLH